MKVIIDTNALLIPYQFKIDIITEMERIVPNPEYVVLDSTMRELSQINEKKAVNIALKTIENNNMTKITASGKTDDAIIKYAKENKAIVFTNDIQMKEKCRNEKIPLISMKRKKSLEIEGM